MARRRPQRRRRERSPTSRRSAPSSGGRPHRRAPAHSAAIATVARASPAPAPDRAAPFGPAEPIPTYQEPPGLERLTPDDDLEPALPDEARDRAAVAARAPTPPLDPSPTAILHVTFATGAGSDRVVGAMEAFKGLLVERPGSTRVVLHVPAPSGGASLPMELRRGVAYDAELLAEVRRRLGEGIVELSLS